jgi:hypothetical protein
MSAGTSMAFKEWASVVLALETGAQDVIFRKGGIAEEGRGFELAARAFWLFPTYFHRQLAGVAPEHGPLLAEAMQKAPPPAQLVIGSWAEVVTAATLTSEAEIDAFAGRHIYARQVLVDRLHGRYGAALHAFTVTVHRVSAPITVPMLEAYGGCRSWVTLDIPSPA